MEAPWGSGRHWSGQAFPLTPSQGPLVLLSQCTTTQRQPVPTPPPTGTAASPNHGDLASLQKIGNQGGAGHPLEENTAPHVDKPTKHPRVNRVHKNF